MKLSYTLALIVAITLLAAPAVAHHSASGFSEQQKEISGTIKEFQFKNPHSWIQVMVPDASGKLVEWSVEWGSPNQLGRQGIRPSSFPPGAKVTMRVTPMANGAPIALFTGAKFEDGKTLGRWQ
jgi:hypothetical protein